MILFLFSTYLIRRGVGIILRMSLDEISTQIKRCTDSVDIVKIKGTAWEHFSQTRAFFDQSKFNQSICNIMLPGLM